MVSKGHPVETEQLVKVDSGIFRLTNKQIYFSGSTKSFRVPYSKIVAFKPYSDGLGFWRDTAAAKLQVLITGEGWFVSIL